MLPNGMNKRIFGTPAINTKQAALEAERAHIERLLQPPRKEVPTFENGSGATRATTEEPNGRFWIEWVIGRKNKPSEQMEKKCIYQMHLQARVWTFAARTRSASVRSRGFALR